MLGVELVKDRATKEPAKAKPLRSSNSPAKWASCSAKAVSGAKAFRFAPPMCITKADADFILEVFDAAFSRILNPRSNASTLAEKARRLLCGINKGEKASDPKGPPG